MIRLFKVYYPLRTLVLLVGEAMIVWLSFVMGTMLQNREDSSRLLQFTERLGTDRSSFFSSR